MPATIPFVRWLQGAIALWVVSCAQAGTAPPPFPDDPRPPGRRDAGARRDAGDVPPPSDGDSGPRLTGDGGGGADTGAGSPDTGVLVPDAGVVVDTAVPVPPPDSGPMCGVEGTPCASLDRGAQCCDGLMCVSSFAGLVCSAMPMCVMDFQPCSSATDCCAPSVCVAFGETGMTMCVTPSPGDGGGDGGF